MNYRIVSYKEGFKQHDISGFSKEEFVRFMGQHGFKYTGDNKNEHSREELKGQPKFLSLLGPLYDRDAIRYESPEAYAQLSV